MILFFKREKSFNFLLFEVFLQKKLRKKFFIKILI
ncbi:hypothetical protein PRO82_000688 [Candidatus Protochlamydia amoebophila]|nr:hypothetical protein [Candidatus Protochlamydia amoebophila]